MCSTNIINSTEIEIFNHTIEDDEEIEDELEEVSEIEKTFCNPNDILKRCPHCSFETYIKDDLVNHMKTENGHKLKCDYCGFIGQTSSGLRAHMTKKHTIVKTCKCFTCDFSCETHRELVSLIYCIYWENSKKMDLWFKENWTGSKNFNALGENPI